MNKNIVVLGLQWGDEGKGKIIDFLSKNVNYIIRYQGGNNAGHTLIIGNKKVILHLIPSCVLHKNVIGIISNGVVISPIALVKEIKLLRKKNIDISNRLFISELCPLVLKYHIKMDLSREKKNNIVIGTTGRGIGPAYEDKIARRGLRMGDLKNINLFSERLKNLVDYYNYQFINYYGVKAINYKDVLEKILKIKDIFLNIICNTTQFLQNIILKANDKLIFEGAQGTFLDIDHGTYPYVTSSNTTIGGVFTGTGIGPKNINYILGVFKSYTTRVGNGPFITEFFGDLNEEFCFKGKEFGSTTGRKRRIGWLDIIALRKAIFINSITGLCITKIDILDFIKDIKICIGYRDSKGYLIEDISSFCNFNNIIPVYKIIKGWNQSTYGIKCFDSLPKEAKNFISIIEELVSTPIDIISTGPDRNHTIVRRNIFNL